MTTLLIPNSFARLGGPSEIATEGFTLLALDEKGCLIRLDERFSNNPETLSGAVIYAAAGRDGQSFKAIRCATKADRYNRFRRPEHLDQTTFNCCEQPCDYWSIYDDFSERFFDLDVSVEEASKMKEGNLFYFFLCKKCGTMHTISV
ncbi:MAG: hypothetical protein LBQ20_09255 [Rhodanobacter sp.]|jgi:hypothetical protein|nr:hypothetical protein [Rhodanobacter sp.]